MLAPGAERSAATRGAGRARGARLRGRARRSARAGPRRTRRSTSTSTRRRSSPTSRTRGPSRARSGTSRAASTAATCSRWGRSSRSADVLGLAPWLMHRLWLGTLLAIAAWGVVRLLDALCRRQRGIAHAGRGRDLPAQPVRGDLREPHERDPARLRAAAVAAARRPPRGAHAARLVVAGRVRAARHHRGRRRQRRGDRRGCCSARRCSRSTSRSCRRCRRRGACGLRLAHGAGLDRSRRSGGSCRSRPGRLRDQLPAVHRAAGGDLGDDQPQREPAADGLLDLVHRGRLQRRSAAVLSATARRCCSTRRSCSRRSRSPRSRCRLRRGRGAGATAPFFMAAAARRVHVIAAGFPEGTPLRDARDRRLLPRSSRSSSCARPTRRRR